MRPRRILIVDDYDDGAETMADALALNGHTCRVARSPLGAFVSVGTFEPDVVIFEWKLASGDALGLTAGLRSLSAKRLFVVVLSTADEPEGFVEREGVDAYMVKPIKPDVLTVLMDALAARASN